MSEPQRTTQSKYVKKKKPDQQPQIADNEVRIKGNMGHVKRYVDYACSLLEGIKLPLDDKDIETEEPETGSNDKEEPQKFDTIVLKATGRAINKAVTTAEVVKRKIPGLHQVTSLETLEIVDVWTPKEEGLNEVETKRRVASISIKLSRNEEDVSKDEVGYQPPIANDAIKPFVMSTRESPQRRRRPYGGRGRGRGGYSGRGHPRRPRGPPVGGRYGGGGRSGGGRRGGGPPMRGDRGYGPRGRGPPGSQYSGRGRGRGRFGGSRPYY